MELLWSRLTPYADPPDDVPERHAVSERHAPVWLGADRAPFGLVRAHATSGRVGHG